MRKGRTIFRKVLSEMEGGTPRGANPVQSCTALQKHVNIWQGMKLPWDVLLRRIESDVKQTPVQKARGPTNNPKQASTPCRDHTDLALVGGGYSRSHGLTAAGP